MQLQNSLTSFWKGVTDPVHPEDRPFLTEVSAFNLEYPVSPYIGDVINAPVLVLYNNGGFDPISTPAEFQDSGRRIVIADAIDRPRPLDPKNISDYYGRNRLRDYVSRGDVAWVNAVAYRSKDARNTTIRKLSRILPSALAAQSWLRNEIEIARAGKKLIVFHRWSLWNIDPKSQAGANVIFSNNPVGANVSGEVIEIINTFLSRRHCSP